MTWLCNKCHIIHPDSEKYCYRCDKRHSEYKKEEKKYPIYHYHFRFIHKDGTKNAIGGDFMEKEKLSEEQMQDKLSEKKNTMIEKYNNKNPVVNFSDEKIEYKKDDTWCLTWFSHYTFNTQLTDEELVQSFSDYVDRNEDACVMGAEDNWRWKPPCRCEHCKKLGVARIDH